MLDAAGGWGCCWKGTGPGLAPAVGTSKLALIKSTNLTIPCEALPSPAILFQYSFK